MTKQSILTQIYESKEVKDCLSYLQPEHLRDDILHHCFLELLEKEDSFILDLHERGKLKSYIVKVIYNTSRFQRSSFKKQLGKETPTDILGSVSFRISEDDEEAIDLRKPNKIFSESIEDLEEAREIELKEKKAVKALENVYWYKKEIFELYVEHGTIRRVNELTGIPRSSIHKTISEVRNEIRALC